MSKLRTGYTTGACSAAAAKAAAMIMTGKDHSPGEVKITLGSGDGVETVLPIADYSVLDNGARASVIKDSGDDPDITNGSRIVVDLFWEKDGDIVFEAGEGVGTVTKAGLSIKKGEPAINPGPRKMIAGAVREITERPVRVRISIPGGEELALKTFNPKLGVIGGLSILGTTGIVRPFSNEAVRESIICLLDVAIAGGYTDIVLAPGNIGARAAGHYFNVAGEQIVEAGNEWGYVIEKAVDRNVRRLLLVGHPGKLAKLAMGQWNTHSKHSKSAAPYIAEVAKDEMGFTTVESETVEGIFSAMEPDKRKELSDLIAMKIADAVNKKSGGEIEISVALVNMKSELIGAKLWSGPWIK
ncbi:Cobalt-precorrin-5B (C1)-methyltransferase [hydrothermal vent metagenome]|uniref:Cobalt-precorrin-5B (C1)-methyltransferase n=1 Tax=hydrothermal vent metagenome TaxID=652676 RepID=A0A3B1CBH0_9ZZZZ